MNSFKLKRYESFIELKDDLKEDTILISEALSDSNKFIKANNDLFEAGFIYYDTGLQPQIKMLCQSQKIFLGVNEIFFLY